MTKKEAKHYAERINAHPGDCNAKIVRILPADVARPTRHSSG
jgi:hypothetical protein